MRENGPGATRSNQPRLLWRTALPDLRPRARFCAFCPAASHLPACPAPAAHPDLALCHHCPSPNWERAQDAGTAKKLAFSREVNTRCITLEGDDFNPGGTLTGGSRNKGGSGGRALGGGVARVQQGEPGSLGVRSVLLHRC